MTWRLFPFAILGKPQPTLHELRVRAWGGMPKAYRVTQPVETRKQWKYLQITRRKRA